MTAAEGQPVVLGVQLSRTYRVGSVDVHAVNGLDIRVPRATLALLKGRSGSGKTTLLNLIGGLDRPTSGDMYVDGNRLKDLSDAEMTELRRSKIGFVFQSFALLPTFSAFENVELPLRIAQKQGVSRTERVRRCLDMVGLTVRDEHRPWELSGGQQQRVAIARSLVNKPSLILADEPTGELDSASGEEIVRLFSRIVHEDGVTVIMSSHDPSVEELADVVYELSDGQVVSVRQNGGDTVD